MSFKLYQDYFCLTDGFEYYNIDGDKISVFGDCIEPKSFPLENILVKGGFPDTVGVERIFEVETRRFRNQSLLRDFDLDLNSKVRIFLNVFLSREEFTTIIMDGAVYKTHICVDFIVDFRYFGRKVRTFYALFDLKDFYNEALSFTGDKFEITRGVLVEYRELVLLLKDCVSFCDSQREAYFREVVTERGYMLTKL